MKGLVKQRVSLIMLALLLAVMLLVAGCGGQEAKDESKGEENGSNGEAELSGTVITAGSTSVQPLSDELARAFMEKHPGVRIEVSGGGSSAGVKAAQTGTADIGAASRNLKENETGVKAVTIAKDGIAVIVHPDNPVEGITMEQVRKIFTGEITNWSEVDGPDANIVVVIREEGSGTRAAFHEIAVGEENSFTDQAIIQNSNGAVREAVSQDKNAIGFVSLGVVNETVKPLKIDGAPATVEAILADGYPIARPLNYVLKEGKELSKAAQAYLDFVLSSEGQKIVEELGYIPVKK